MPHDVLYTSLAAVKADLGITHTRDDTAITQAISAASREVDGHTGTAFGVDGGDATARRYYADPTGEVAVDRFTSTDGLIIKTGTGGNYSTTVPESAYVLEPLNAAADGLAYHTIRMFGSPTWWFGFDGRPTVQVTALWGWANVPAPVEFATRLRAIHLYHRREAPHGTAAYGDDGVIGRNVLTSDADVVALLVPYTDPGVS